ncbi:zinc-ribbon domain-containing protein [Cribrihabitans neustonicus]|uniref:zinc-ribbon domain-containing protein n=1 Tax=Cribrihabitans neustonicus TaxID=1429085 RepID=UPI003B58CF45
MRLTCPNCAAQYEVPDDVIPAEGRDVQCSECDQTWFQPGVAEEAAAQAPDTTRPEHTKPEAPETAAPDAPESGTPAPETPQHDPAPGPAPEPPAPRARGLDPELSDILREEAARESALRAAEAQALETQPDLGLDAMPGGPPARPRRAERPEHHEQPERIARARRGARPAAEARDQDWRRNGLETEAAAAGSRRDLLPDIEEINSTLRAGESATAAGAADGTGSVRRRQGGFARGFTLSLLVMLALVMTYANAPLIAEYLPQAGSALEGYVAWVDQLRLWLDVQVKSLTAA